MADKRQGPHDSSPEEMMDYSSPDEMEYSLLDQPTVPPLSTGRQRNTMIQNLSLPVLETVQRKQKLLLADMIGANLSPATTSYKQISLFLHDIELEIELRKYQQLEAQKQKTPAQVPVLKMKKKDSSSNSTTPVSDRSLRGTSRPCPGRIKKRGAVNKVTLRGNALRWKEQQSDSSPSTDEVSKSRQQRTKKQRATRRVLPSRDDSGPSTSSDIPSMEVLYLNPSFGNSDDSTTDDDPSSPKRGEGDYA